MRQLYANNAKTTLASSVSFSDSSILVTDASLFPSPAANEFFLVTLEIGSQVEIVLITSRVGNTLVVAGAGRGQEGTIAGNFPILSKVECRVTRDTLVRLSKALVQLASVELLVAPKDAFNDGYVCGTYDPTGNPVIVIAKDLYTWRYINYTLVFTGTATSGTTTSVTAVSIPLSTVTSGKYMVQFTSGLNVGLVRPVTSISTGVCSWTTALPNAVIASDTFEIVKANSSILLEAMALNDDAIIMPLILGGN